MVDTVFDGTAWSNFPFSHLANTSNENVYITNNIAANIIYSISTNIVVPFPDALHVVHINAEYIICHFADVHELFFSSNIHVILVSETWMKPFHPDSMVHIAGYKICRHDRVGKGGGGVCAYIRDVLDFNFLCASDLDTNRPEYLFFELLINCNKILIGVVYKAPHLGFLSDIEEVLYEILPLYDHEILAGDFNVDLLDKSRRSSQLLNIFYAF
jgi:hypothetical protein